MPVHAFRPERFRTYGMLMIPTDKPIVVVTGPGPGSGKFATCLTMLYHEVKKGKQANMAMLARALSVMAKAD